MKKAKARRPASNAPSYKPAGHMRPAEEFARGQGHRRFRTANFILSAAAPAQAPEDQGCEVAFGGRSNAGKSSALNALTGHGRLARVSKTPGRTQQLNFFELDAHARLVDLPGYGFAKVPLRVKMAWGHLVEGYLEQRASLAGLVVIMDVRRPLMDLDQQLVDWALAAKIPCHAVLTKADKLSRNQGASSLSLARQALAVCAQESGIHISAQLFSAPRGQGVDELGAVLEGMLWPQGGGTKVA